jgi:hypothetical protein
MTEVGGNEALTALGVPATAATEQTQDPGAAPSCQKLREMIKSHIRGLIAEEDETKFKIANLGLWYHEYIDGINKQAPQIIPALGLLKRLPPLRVPFEILEMTLLVCAGALGGIIGVTRFVIDPSEPKPSIREFISRPAAGVLLLLEHLSCFVPASCSLERRLKMAAVPPSACFCWR